MKESYPMNDVNILETVGKLDYSRQAVAETPAESLQCQTKASRLTIKGYKVTGHYEDKCNQLQ